MFVAIFLDDVPEGTELTNGSQTLRRSGDDHSTADRGPAEYLFDQITTSNPLFTGHRLDLEQRASGVTPEQTVFHNFVLDKVVVGSTAAVSTSVSVGYVVWMLRGGSLMATMLSSLPAWQSFDPLPVLDSFEGQDDGDDDESLLTMVS